MFCLRYRSTNEQIVILFLTIDVLFFHTHRLSVSMDIDSRHTLDWRPRSNIIYDSFDLWSRFLEFWHFFLYFRMNSCIVHSKWNDEFDGIRLIVLLFASILVKIQSFWVKMVGNSNAANSSISWMSHFPKCVRPLSIWATDKCVQYV